MPIYTLGSAEPRSFSRGNRGIAGTLIFSVFDRDALLASFQDEENGLGANAPTIQKFVANDSEYVNTHGDLGDGTKPTSGFTSIDDWDRMMSDLTTDAAIGNTTAQFGPVVGQFKPHYADEILPFDITLTFKRVA